MSALQIALGQVRMVWRAFHGQMARAGIDAVARERALASATFACIFSLGVFCMDQIITGGVDWNPGDGQAYAQAPASHTSAPLERDAAPLATPAPSYPVSFAAASEVDFRFTTQELLGGPEIYPDARVLDVSWVVADSETENSQKKSP